MGEALFEDLLQRYAEPHRAYHDTRHLAEVMAVVDDLEHRADDIEAVRLAAWFHDAVYDPTRDDNEERSATLAEETLTKIGLPPVQVGEVARLVRLTATHDAHPDDRNGSLLCDADLAILAASPDRYDEYVAGVRAEYAHVPDDAFRAGRAAVLRALLAMPSLFRTAEGQQRWEAPARDNVERELAALTA